MMRRGSPKQEASGGFSLIEVTIGLAIMAIGSLALMHLMTNSAKFNRSIAATADFQNQTNLVATALQDSSQCGLSQIVGATFMPAASAYPAFNTLSSPTAGVLIQKTAYSGFTVNRLDFVPGSATDIRDITPSPPPVGSKTYLATLHIAAMRPMGGPVSRDISFVLDVDTLTNRISRCRVSGQGDGTLGPQEMCVALNGTYDNASGRCYPQLDQNDCITMSTASMGDCNGCFTLTKCPVGRYLAGMAIQGWHHKGNDDYGFQFYCCKGSAPAP